MSRILTPLGFIALLIFSAPNIAAAETFTCGKVYVVDGDTLHCGKVKIRLRAIDAPEMHECPKWKKCVAGDPVAATEYLRSLTSGGVTCDLVSRDNYGRWIGDCSSKKAKSLSCAMVEAGHAVERYGTLDCE